MGVGIEGKEAIGRVTRDISTTLDCCTSGSVKSVLVLVVVRERDDRTLLVNVLLKRVVQVDGCIGYTNSTRGVTTVVLYLELSVRCCGANTNPVVRTLEGNEVCTIRPKQNVTVPVRVDDNWKTAGTGDGETVDIQVIT